MDRIAMPNTITSQGRILIVDDDVSFLEMIRNGLSLKGYHCETAENATSALELVSENTFHSMITDVMLPDMIGFELTEKVKKLKPEMVVIIMTGFIDDFSYKDATEAGASDFIKKPFSLKELIARIEHATLHEKLHTISLRDDLTGLYNRRGFFTLAEHLLKMAKRQQEGLFMLYADVDDLKEINDTLGHQKGDWALIDTANILKETFRGSDIIARIGGDEFVVMPIEAKGDNLEIVMNRLRKAVELDNAACHRDYELSISAGAVYFDPRSACTIDELLSQTDKSMYQQKRNKHNA